MEVSKINYAFFGNPRVVPEEKLSSETEGGVTPLQENNRASPREDLKSANPKDSRNISGKEIQGALETLNEKAQFLNTGLRFLYDGKKELIVIRVVEKDRKLGEEEKVIRQIPAEEMIKLAESLKKLGERMFKKGFLLNLEG